MFSHRDEPSRTATLRADGAAWVVEHTDAAGKRRTKRFTKPQPWQAHDAALRFLLNAEGYVIRAPQPGPVAWMARLLLDGYRGEIGHDVGPDGVVWVYDAEDQAHRISPGTCATTTVRLGSGSESPGASVAAGPGEAWCLAPSWRRVDGALVRHVRVYRVADVATLVVDVTGSVVDQLSRARTGLVLGPAPGGAALYAPDLVRALPCEPLGEGHPVAALSDDGAWVVTTHGDHLRRTRLATGEVSRLRADGFKGLDRAQVTDDGTTYVAGFRYPSHGLWRLDPDTEPVRVSEDVRATVAADGRRIAEVGGGRVRIADPRGPGLATSVAEVDVPVLGMAKYGRARFVPDGVVALTDAYTVAHVRVG